MKLEAFRKIIREEVRAVIKEELSLIMKAPIAETKVFEKPVVEQKVKKPTLSELTEEPKQEVSSTPLFEGSNPLAEVLNQTYSEGGWRNLNGGTFQAQDAISFAGGMPNGQTRVVDSVDAMIGNQKTSDINQVTIEAVPDFSGLMSKMKDAGKL
jgi:hypothetical protein